MNKLLLTCSGIEGNEISKRFIEMIGASLDKAKILWIPTAAIDKESVVYTEKCKADLFRLSIDNQNITVYNLDKTLNLDELNTFEVVFVCGGDCHFLLDKMISSKFYQVLENYNGLYVGVSAGSCVVSYDFPECMNYLKCRLDVHCQTGSNRGIIDIDNTDLISLTNSQAVVIDGENIEVI